MAVVFINGQLVEVPTLGVTYADSPNLDAFARLRVSNLNSLIDLKQVEDDASLFFDTQVNGTGVATYSPATSSTFLTVSANNDYAIRQTFQRFNYQTGKSQLCIFTFSQMQNVANVQKRIGVFQTSTVAPYTGTPDGIYLEADGTDISVNIAFTGTINKVTQSNWNVDTLDGTGASGITLDFSKSNIFFIDYEWLGVGRVRCGFFVDGQPVYCHYFNNANNLAAGVYMKSPNQPVRYEIRSTGGVGTLEQICSTIASEGSNNVLGFERSVRDAVDFQANRAGQNYGIYGIRLKATQLNAKIDIIRVSLVSETDDDFIWSLVLNPTVTNAPTYNDLANSAVQIAVGIDGGGGATQISGGIILDSGVGIPSATVNDAIQSALSIGVSIDGTRDEIWLAVEPRSAGLDLSATETFRQKI